MWGPCPGIFVLLAAKGRELGVGELRLSPSVWFMTWIPVLVRGDALQVWHSRGASPGGTVLALLSCAASVVSGLETRGNRGHWPALPTRLHSPAPSRRDPEHSPEVALGTAGCGWQLRPRMSWIAVLIAGSAFQRRRDLEGLLSPSCWGFAPGPVPSGCRSHRDIAVVISVAAMFPSGQWAASGPLFWRRDSQGYDSGPKR